MTSLLDALSGGPGEELLRNNPYAGIAANLAKSGPPTAENSTQAFLFPLIQGLATGLASNLSRGYEKDRLFDYYKNNPLIKQLRESKERELADLGLSLDNIGPVADGGQYSKLLEAAPLAAYLQESAPDNWTVEQGKADVLSGLLYRDTEDTLRKQQEELALYAKKKAIDEQAEMGLLGNALAGLTGGTAPEVGGIAAQGAAVNPLVGIPKNLQAEAIKEIALKANADQQMSFALNEFEKAKQVGSITAAIPGTNDAAILDGVITNLRTSLQSALGREMNAAEQIRLENSLPDWNDTEEIIETKKQNYADLLRGGMSKATPILSMFGKVSANQTTPQSAVSGAIETKPSVDWGTRAGQGIMALNDAFTLGAGDEIAAGGNALIDALSGKDSLGSAYDKWLNKARQIEQETPLGMKIAAAVPAAAMMPISGAATVAQAVKQGAGLGGAMGFLEGEGGLVERAKSALVGAGTGGATSGVLASGANVIKSAVKGSPKMAEAAENSIYGITAADVKASAKNAGLVKGVSGEIEGTKLAQSARELTKAGFLKGKIDAPSLVEKAATKVNELYGKIKPLLKKADATLKKEGKSVEVNWLSTKQLIEKLSGSDKTTAAKIFDEELGLLKEQGFLSSLVKLQELKQSFWTKAFGPDDKVKDELFKAMGRDVRRTLERTTEKVFKNSSRKTIRQINQEMGRYLDVLPKLSRKAAAESAQTIDQKIINAIKTTGGAGTGILASMYSGNPLPAALGISTLLGTTDRGRLLSAAGLRSLGNVNADALIPRAGVASRIITDVATNPSKKKTKTAAMTSNKGTTSGDNSASSGIDLDRLVNAVIGQESGGNAQAVGYETPETRRQGARALGLMQIMPNTAKDIARELGVRDYDLFDPETNKTFGRHYLAKMLQQFNNDPELALTAYHSGPATVARLLKQTGGKSLADIVDLLGPAGRKYAKGVLSRYGV